MKPVHYFKGLTVTMLLLLSIIANAQTKSPFVLNLSEDGNHYVKFGMNAQLWNRYTELNPGSAVGSNETDHAFDIVIRRVRMQAFIQLSDKVFFHIQLGTNNVNFTNNKSAPIAVLDFLGEYHFSEHLHIGTGINGWGAGTTRYSAQSSSSQLTLDAPIYQQNNISGNFGNRNITTYAKGRLGQFNYRLAVTNPYLSNVNDLNANAATVSTRTPKAQALGMLTYQFFDKEQIVEPYNKATYLGTKKILNLAIGYMGQPKAMWRLDGATSDTIYSSMSVFGADIFYDAPINDQGAALTAYLSYNYCGYGKNYTRMIATPNPAYTGSGSGFIGIGSGNIYYTQVGYLLNNNQDSKGKLQFYASTEVAALEALKTPMVMYEGGFNYYFNGSFGSKISFVYQNRSFFANTGDPKLVETTRKSMVVVQYQFSF